MEDAATPLRERYATLIEVRYGARLNQLNARLYRHLRTFFTMMAVTFGSGAIVTAMDEAGIGARVAFAVTAIFSAFNLVVAPGDRAVHFQERCRKFVELEAKSTHLSDVEFEGAMLELRASEVPASFETLRNAAMNDVMRENGHLDYVVHLSRWERLVAFFS